ncbi:MAG: potassium transporter TrkG [Kiritimatiellia bacterium]
MKRRASIAFGFLALIALGAVLLACPWAQTDGAWGNPAETLFTACSAVCVTGLSVVDISATYSWWGQIVLLCLVEVGCLGLMTCGTFLLIAVGRRLSLSREFSLMNAYGVEQVQGLRSLICWVIGSMAVIEAVGAFACYLRLHDVYESVYFAIMSFCNAGFNLRAGWFAGCADDPYLVFVSAFLSIMGGIGFLVIYNLCTFKFMRRRSGGKGQLTLHTRVVLRFTGYLLAAAFVAFLLTEWEGALKGMPFVKKLYVAFYQAVAPRTCGFCIAPTEEVTPLTQLIYEFLMFIGGGPGSATGGIKVTTFAVLCYTLTAMCRGETETVIARKVIPSDIVRESLVILMVLIMITAVLTGALFHTELPSIRAGTVSLHELFFETVSAITTTGLSIGSTTADLSPAGRCVIMVAMFVGRLGALTVVMMIGDRESNRHVRFPTEEIVVG